MSQLTRIQQQLAFIVELDKLKYVLRKTRLIPDHRHENTAEHSWHVTLLALVLHEHANEPVNLLHVLKMLLVHDIVEIDAGDTFAFGDQSDKASREQQAAERIFGLLPVDQHEEFRRLWEEFEARHTPEARFANAMDRLMPVLHNMNTNGGSWFDHGISRTQVNKRLNPIGDGSQSLWQMVEGMLDDAVTRGYLKDA
jgi:putative hydrolase of HD superfamily